MSLNRRAEALKFLWGRINYERQQPPRRRDGFKLAAMRELNRVLGQPQERYPVIHVAGTKGKGSTATLIASILTAAGLKTGLYTSPHLHDIEERIQVDGRPIEGLVLTDLLERLRGVTEQLDEQIARGDLTAHPPTFFELLTAAAWCHFAEQEVDVAVVEVGLGGRLDSTNVCRAEVGVITSISLDHTQQLGDSLGQIAAEKAGIIKPGMTVITGVADPESLQAIRSRVQEQRATLLELGTDFQITDGERVGEEPAGGFYFSGFDHPTWNRHGFQTLGPLSLALAGEHQRRNAGLAIAATLAFRDLALGDSVELAGQQETLEGAYQTSVRSVARPTREQAERIGPEAVAQGLAAARLAGRIETLSLRPRVIVDVSHNPAAIRALLDWLPAVEPGGKRVLLVAISEDKDAETILRLVLPRFDHILLTRFEENPRAISPERLWEMAQRHAEQLDDPPLLEQLVGPDAVLPWVRSRLGTEDQLVVCGSTFLVAETRQRLAEHFASSPVVG